MPTTKNREVDVDEDDRSQSKDTAVRDPLAEARARIEAALDELGPKIRSAFEELDGKVDAALADFRPRARSALREIPPRIDDLRRELQHRAARSASRHGRAVGEIEAGGDAEASDDETDEAAGA